MNGWTAFFIFFASIPVGGVIIVALVLHYLKRARLGDTLSNEDQRRLAELWRQARELEQRSETLEQLLDRQDPRWREKHDQSF